MRRVLTAILATVLLVAPMVAAPGPDNSKSHHASGQKAYQIGKASWYGKKFNGKETASGEPFDMFLFTAAHRTLPLGTLVRVTNLANGNSLVVRINDRGPVPKSRIIDLSYAAAQILGMRARGVARVRLDIVGSEQNEDMLAQNVSGQ